MVKICRNRACIETYIKAETMPCGKEGDKLWITCGKMLSSERASQHFMIMNGGKSLSLPKELLYKHCNEDSLYYQSRHGLQSCSPYLWSVQRELLQEDPPMEGCYALKKRLS
jgi:hypothetical protein